MSKAVACKIELAARRYVVARHLVCQITSQACSWDGALRAAMVRGGGGEGGVGGLFRKLS